MWRGGLDEIYKAKKGAHIKFNLCIIYKAHRMMFTLLVRKIRIGAHVYLINLNIVCG